MQGLFCKISYTYFCTYLWGGLKSNKMQGPFCEIPYTTRFPSAYSVVRGLGSHISLVGDGEIASTLPAQHKEICQMWPYSLVELARQKMQPGPERVETYAARWGFFSKLLVTPMSGCLIEFFHNNLCNHASMSCANELLGSCYSIIFTNLGQYLMRYPLIFVRVACCAGL
jgi:hypothetical protein